MMYVFLVYVYDVDHKDFFDHHKQKKVVDRKHWYFENIYFKNFPTIFIIIVENRRKVTKIGNTYGVPTSYWQNNPNNPN